MRSQPSTSSTRPPGFTLVEILIVVGIIALLLAILVPALSSVRGGAQKTAALAQLGALQTGLQQYFADFNMYPPSAPAYGGIPANRGGAMLAQGLMGYLAYDLDGAGPTLSGGGASPSPADPTFGFRTRRNAAMGGGQIFGPYATADAKTYKINSASDQAFIDPWGHEILYYRSTRSVVGAPANPVNLIFGTGGNNFYFDKSDCSATRDAAGNVIPSPDSLSSPSDKFYSLINSSHSNNVAGPVTGASSYLLIGAGYDEKYFTADDLAVGK